MIGATVERTSSTCLLSLLGYVAGKKNLFLLDSGASCNFIGKKTLLDLGLDWDLTQSTSVKLADGQQFQTRG